MIKWISNKPYAAFVFLIFSAVIIAFSLSFNFLCKHIFPNTSVGIYDKDFWVNLLVNLNSSIIDFLFLGLVILYIDKKIQKEKDNKNHQEMIQEKIETLRRDLKDYAEHSTIELDLRKAGIIRDLCKLNEHKIDVRKIQIHEVALRDIDLIDSDLSGLSLYRSKLEKLSFKKCILRSLNLMEGNSKKLSFHDCTIRNMKLNNGSFKAIEFKNCSLVNSKMNNAELNSAIFINCDLQNVTFENSNLRSANFKGCRNINVDQLTKAKCLDYIIADEDILSKVKALRNDVKMKKDVGESNTRHAR